MMWDELLIAIALLLVLEGIMPFLNPAGMRRSLLLIAEMNDATLRTMGFVSMLLGLILLYSVH